MQDIKPIAPVDEIDAWSHFGTELLSIQSKASAHARNEAIGQIPPRLRALRLELLGLIRILYKEVDRGAEFNQLQLDRFTQVGAFVQGVVVTESCILDGQGVKGAAALRQEIEIVTRLNELEAGKARAGKTPNIGNHFTPMKELYQSLCEITHPSNEELYRNIMHKLVGTHVDLPTYSPSNHEYTCNDCYEIHVVMLTNIVGHLLRLLAEMNGQDPTIAACGKRWLEIGQVLSDMDIAKTD